MGEPVLLEAIRTPFARQGGAFREERPDALLAHALRGLVGRVGCRVIFAEGAAVTVERSADGFEHDGFFYR